MRPSKALLTVFSATIEERYGVPTVSIPNQELDLGGLELGESYRIAVLARPDESTATTQSHTQRTRGHNQTGPTPPVEVEEVREVDIEDLGEQGDGLARVGRGYIVFVPDTQVGDRVTVEITETKATVAFAEEIETEATDS